MSEDLTLTREIYQVRVDIRLRCDKQWTLPPVILPKPRTVVVRCDIVAHKAVIDILCAGTFERGHNYRSYY